MNASNISTLGRVAWTVPINAHGQFGAYATTPVVANGVLVTQDLASNVEAINVGGGKGDLDPPVQLARRRSERGDIRKREALGATNRAAFALDASTGKQLWCSRR